MNEPTPSTVATEAWLDLTSQAGRTVMTMFIVLVTVGGLAGLEGLSTGAIVDDEARFVQLGGSTVAVSRETGSLDAATCAGLDSQPWALRVGGYGTTDAVSIARSPSTRYTHYLTTANALAVIVPGQQVPDDVFTGVVVGPAAASSLGVTVGDRLVVDGQPRPVAMVMSPDRLRVPLFERAVVTVGPATTIDACLVDVDRATADADLLAARAAFGGGRDIRATMYAQRGEFAVAPDAALAARPQRTAWLAVGAILGALLALDTWTRRSELAVQRATGGSVPSLTTIVATVRALQLLPAAVAGLAIATGIVVVVQGRVVGDQVMLMLRQATGSVAVALTIAVVATAATAGRSTAATLKDR